jgi:phospholipid/cholesterol/gamma-HCH transport system substrate-binding protein
MEKEAHYFVVGLFVTLSLLAVVAFTVWLAGSHGFTQYDRYTVYFTDPVGGLNEDGAVRYKGVEVGKILALRLSPERSDLVKVDIEVKARTPVRTNTSAKIQSQGIAGSTYIDLDTPNLKANPPEKPADERYPVLKGTGNQLSELIEGLPALSHQLEGTLSAVTDFSRNGAKAAESIKGLADVLKEDPSRIIHNNSRQGVEIPK